MKYRKKPVIVEAIQFTGTKENLKTLEDFIDRAIITESDFISDNYVDRIEIETLEGNHVANVGDYIIQGVQGEHYPCKPDIFKSTYDKVDD